MKSIHRITLLAASALLVLAPLSQAQTESAHTILFDEVDRLFSGMREDTYMPDAKLTSTIWEFLSSNRGEREFGDGTAMVSGCRAHSCIEKAAGIVDQRSRRLLAVALINYGCNAVFFEREALERYNEHRRNPYGAVDCGPPELLIYVIRRTATKTALENELRQVERLRMWGQAQLHTLFEKNLDRERIKVLYRPDGWERDQSS